MSGLQALPDHPSVLQMLCLFSYLVSFRPLKMRFLRRICYKSTPDSPMASCLYCLVVDCCVLITLLSYDLYFLTRMGLFAFPRIPWGICIQAKFRPALLFMSEQLPAQRKDETEN